MTRLVTSLAILLLVAAAASAQEGSDDALAAALAAIRDADASARSKAIEAVLALDPDLDDVRRALAAGLPAPAAKPGWHVLAVTDATGATRPCHVYVPSSIADSSTAAPLLVDMHGGVSRPEFIPDEMFARFRGAWTALAEEHRFVVAVPLARHDCVWWSDAGLSHVRASIRHAKRLAPIDPDGIVATGFSDGGSGCYYIAMAAPDPFAAVMPMNGHPGVAVTGSGRQMYLENMRLLPLFVAMTQDDGLYPARSVLPHVLRLVEIGTKVNLVSYPTGGHRPSYFEDQKAAFARFVTSAVRDPLPGSISWRTAEPATGTVRWLEVLELGPAQGDAPAPEEVNVMSRPGRVLLGIRIDGEFPGPGVRVLTVTPETPAATMGLAEGDVIRSVDGIEITDLRTLRGALGGKDHGDAVTVAVDRAESRLALEGRFPPFRPAPVYPRSRPTASIDLVASGNRIEVRTHRIRRFRLLLSPEVFALDEEIVVAVNGVERARVVPDVSLERMLERYAVEADARRLFPAELTVEIPAAE